MHKCSHIGILLTFAVFVISNGVGSLCSVLCQESIAQSVVTGDKCNDSAIQNCETACEKEKLSRLNAQFPGSNCCNSCLELPKCSEGNGYVFPQLSKVKELVFSEHVCVFVPYESSSHVSTSSESFAKRSWLDTRFQPLLA